MSTLAHARTTALAWLGGASNRTLVLPLVVYFPTSRCNSRCVSCEWWKSTGQDDLSFDEVERLACALERLGTRLVVFSGGEPLLRADLFDVADLFRARGIRLHLLTSGLGLAPRAREIAGRFERVVVSLDAAVDRAYADVRGIDGLGALEAGVTALRAAAPALPIGARSTLHRRNFHQLPLLAAKARVMGLSSISFLPADVTSAAFGRQRRGAAADLLLTREEIREFRVLVDALVHDEADAFSSGFIAESPSKLRALVQHYEAMLGDAPFPRRACDAPWVSAVVEANGDVRPCFFHDVVGSVRSASLPTIVRTNLRQFRATLDVAANDVCRRCVCSLKVDWSRAPWN